MSAWTQRLVSIWSRCWPHCRLASSFSTLISPDWIEIVFGIEPDEGNGILGVAHRGRALRPLRGPDHPGSPGLAPRAVVHALSGATSLLKSRAMPGWLSGPLALRSRR